jgi:hypothetical protein
VHRYVIACEVKGVKGAAAVADTVRRLALHWERPLDGLWIVETRFKANEIHAALQGHLGIADRLYVVEAGSDMAETNALALNGHKVTPLAPNKSLVPVRHINRMLTAIFSRTGKTSRHLTAATSENLKSA